MQMIVDIFKQLGVDDTIFTQFALVFVLFFLIKNVLMAKLQDVIELREGKTTKLEGDANQKFQEAEQLSQKYNDKIAEANAKAQKIFSDKKDEVNSDQKKVFEAAEKKTDAEVLDKKKKYEEELKKHKELVMQNADSLASNLINKITE